MARQDQDYNPRRINRYVPGMEYAAGFDMSSAATISFGKPAAADTDGLLDGVNTATIGTVITVEGNSLLGVIGNKSDAAYGRNVTVTGAGAGAAVFDVRGRDYWGQPMMETITCSGGAGTGVKCFMWVDSITVGATAGDSDTDFGWGAVLGLPYKAKKVLSEELAGVPATLGTLTAPVLTDPQTATTGDPRGRYTPNSTLSTASELTATFLFDNWANASGNGGLHGIAHYFA